MKVLVAVIIAVTVVFLAIAIPMSIKTHNAWVADCEARGGHVSDVTKTSTGVGVGANGKPVTTTSTQTTYYCITDDGRLLKVS